MQTLALDIAGRSMFSLEMDRHGAAMRRLLTEFGEKYAQPRMLDMVLPPSIPTPKDIGRAWFKRRWMRLMETILSARLATPQPDTPRDLFDLLRAARDPETGAGFSPEQLRDQVATLILAGHETTAVTLFWALIMLAEAPDGTGLARRGSRRRNDRTRNGLCHDGNADSHTCGRERGAAAVSGRLHDRAGGDRRGSHRRTGAAAPDIGDDRPVGAAPPPRAVARSRPVPSGAVHAGSASPRHASPSCRSAPGPGSASVPSSR